MKSAVPFRLLKFTPKARPVEALPIELENTIADVATVYQTYSAEQFMRFRSAIALAARVRTRHADGPAR